MINDRMHFGYVTVAMINRHEFINSPFNYKVQQILCTVCLYIKELIDFVQFQNNLQTKVIICQ